MGLFFRFWWEPASGTECTQKRAASTGGPLVHLKEARLLRGLLARRIERAGIVDLGDLVIAEA